MKPMLASRDRARLVSACAAFSCAALGCAEQDHSIGWQEIAGPDTGVAIDVTADTSVGTDATADKGVGTDATADKGVGTDVIADTGIGIDVTAGDAGRFTRVWRDDFDTLDPARWEVAEHTFEENYADFSADNARAEGGFLKLFVRTKPAGSSGKPYSAAEVRTWAPSACGKFLVSARIAPGAGVVSTFFGFHDFFQNASSQDWNEIVIESSATSRIDYVYTRENPALPSRKDRVASQRTVPFDATAGFHVYGFEWTPTEVRYLVDGGVEYSLPVAAAADLNRPKRMVMSAYPSTRLAPGRTFDPSVLPTEAWYDWIEVYRYDGPCPTGADGGMDAGASDAAGP
jgi:endo-1,3-1,4-beta-glycanase ExoK